jgi:hypothetical protein
MKTYLRIRLAPRFIVVCALTRVALRAPQRKALRFTQYTVWPSLPPQSSLRSCGFTCNVRSEKNSRVRMYSKDRKREINPKPPRHRRPQPPPKIIPVSAISPPRHCRSSGGTPHQRCAALSKAVLVGLVVSSLSLPPLSSLLLSSLVVTAAVAIVVVVVFVESSSATSTAATTTHYVFHSIPIVFC